MASLSTEKKCATDNCKQGAVTNCEGCSKTFCIKHIIDHHRSLGEQMKPLIGECERLRKALTQQTTKPESHALVKEIDNWERESIAKIQERAKELRQILLQPTAVHTSDLQKKLQELSEQLKLRRENDSFIEPDIDRWKQELKDLQAKLTSSATTLINRRKNDSLIESISIGIFKIATEESFERVSDASVRIEEDGKVVVCDGSDSCTEIRGKTAYKSGCHEIRLRIEELSNSWTFLGVNSESIDLKNDSYKFKSTYGWSNDNCIWFSAEHEFNRLTPRIEMKKDDIISLMFDCDNHTIAMVNKRTNAKHELNVDVLQCPLPWQIHIILCEPNSRVRILSINNADRKTL